MADAADGNEVVWRAELGEDLVEELRGQGGDTLRHLVESVEPQNAVLIGEGTGYRVSSRLQIQKTRQIRHIGTTAPPRRS